VIANNSAQTVQDVFWVVWSPEDECRVDWGYVRTIAPNTLHSVRVFGPSGGDSAVHLEFTDAEGVVWYRAQRLLTFDEYLSHPDRDKWEDHERVWSNVWPDGLIRRYIELTGEDTAIRPGPSP
jgi:hypothetical protein